MIPTQNLVAWGNIVPWADPRQVEQDLIISRARAHAWLAMQLNYDLAQAKLHPQPQVRALEAEKPHRS